MNKLQLIQTLKDATDLSKSEAAAVVDIFFNEMANELANGGRVEIRGLCSFFGRNTLHTLDEILKPGNESRSNRRGCLFLNRERN